MSVEVKGAATSDVAIEVDVDCGACGRALDASMRRGSLIVDPCESCMAGAREEGRNEVEA